MALLFNQKCILEKVTMQWTQRFPDFSFLPKELQKIAIKCE